MTPNNHVFKLVGPVLIKQDQAEAKGNVDKRLEFIRGEMCAFQWMSRVDYAQLSDSKRIEAQLQEIEQKSEKKKMEVSVFFFSYLNYDHRSSPTAGRITDRVTRAPEAGWDRWICTICIIGGLECVSCTLIEAQATNVGYKFVSILER